MSVVQGQKQRHFEISPPPYVHMSAPILDSATKFYTSRSSKFLRGGHEYETDRRGFSFVPGCKSVSREHWPHKLYWLCCQWRTHDFKQQRWLDRHLLLSRRKVGALYLECWVGRTPGGRGNLIYLCFPICRPKRTLYSKKYGCDLLQYTHAPNTIVYSSNKLDGKLRQVYYVCV